MTRKSPSDFRSEARRKSRKSCERKRQTGRAVAEKIAAQMTDAGKPVAAYKCPACKGWHVGRPNKWAPA
jgi:hypothetical protein